MECITKSGKFLACVAKALDVVFFSSLSQKFPFFSAFYPFNHYNPLKIIFLVSSDPPPLPHRLNP